MTEAAILPFAEPEADFAARLDPEAARLVLLIDAAYRHRDGKTSTADQRRTIEAAQGRALSPMNWRANIIASAPRRG